MTAADTEAMTALQDLLAERQQYQGWLRVLDERRGSTPKHVYERVHTDYSHRLDRVIQRLGERAEQLSATIESLAGRLNVLRTKEGEKTDERQESELRAAVGEFTPEEWERRRTEADDELRLLARDREAVEAELDEMQRIVALTHESDAAPAQPAAAQIAESDDAGSIAGRIDMAQPDSGETPAGGRSAGSQPGSEAEPRPVATSTDTTPSIDEFVADWPVPQVGAESATAAAIAASAPQGDGIAEVPEVDNAASVHGGNGVRISGAHGGIGHGAASAAPQRESPPVPSADAGRESDKTLRCPECGAMNYATEWYCERCGGELSSF